MRIEILTYGFPLTDALQQHAERRLHCALARLEDCVHRVVMRLSDVNGPRGGTDKRCHLQVVLRGMPAQITEDTEADMYAAINRATSRAGHSLVRRVKRRLPQRGYPHKADAPGYIQSRLIATAE